jgi:hypothetical protein
MAHLRSTQIDYEGIGDRVFQQQQAIMEDLRDQIPSIEYDPSRYDPSNEQGSVFGGGTTHYSNGNRPSMAVNQAQMANNPSMNRTGAVRSVFDLHSNEATYDNIPLSRRVNYSNAYNTPLRMSQPPVDAANAQYQPNELLLVTDSRTKTRSPF